MTHKFRFGVQVSGMPGENWGEQARKMEDLGYSTLYMPDHFVDTRLAPMPAMAIAAAHTTTLRVGALVFDNDYKHPAILAKEMATIDELTDGRCGARHRRGLDEDRLRRARPPVRLRGRAHRAARRGAAGDQGLLGRRAVQLRGHALPDPRLRRAAEAEAAAGPADPDRRRRTEGAATRGPRGRHRRDQPQPARGP